MALFKVIHELIWLHGPVLPGFIGYVMYASVSSSVVCGTIDTQKTVFSLVSI